MTLSLHLSARGVRREKRLQFVADAPCVSEAQLSVCAEFTLCGDKMVGKTMPNAVLPLVLMVGVVMVVRMVVVELYLRDIAIREGPGYVLCRLLQVRLSQERGQSWWTDGTQRPGEGCCLRPAVSILLCGRPRVTQLLSISCFCPLENLICK